MATDTKSEISAGMPPYIPFGTVSGFIAKLKETTVPTAIDKSMMRNIPGGVQSYLLGALRFLGLTEGKANEVTPALEKLVEAHGTEGFKPALAEIVKAAYAETIGSIDLTKATAKQLDDAFGKRNLDGVVRDRAIRFYLKALADADIRFSPLLGARKPKGTGSAGNGKPRKTKAKAAGSEAGGENPKPAESHDHDPPSKDTQRYPLYFKGKAAGALIVPVALTLADCKVIELQLAVLKAYAGGDGD
jgi:hypothetical protein